HRIVMREHDRDRVEAVAEIVRDHAERDQQSHVHAGLKSNSDCDSVEKTVHRETSGSHRAELLLMSRDFMIEMFARVMECLLTLEPEKREEPNCDDRHVRSAVIERKNLWQDVEQRNR